MAKEAGLFTTWGRICGGCGHAHASPAGAQQCIHRGGPGNGHLPMPKQLVGDGSYTDRLIYPCLPDGTPLRDDQLGDWDPDYDNLADWTATARRAILEAQLGDVEEVAEAAKRLTATEAALREAVREAHRGGAAVSVLATMAGVSRPTIYRWLATAE